MSSIESEGFTQGPTISETWLQPVVSVLQVTHTNESALAKGQKVFREA